MTDKRTSPPTQRTAEPASPLATPERRKPTAKPRTAADKAKTTAQPLHLSQGQGETEAAAGGPGAEPAPGLEPGATPKPKHAGGRPRKIESPEEMLRLVDDYLESCLPDEAAGRQGSPITLTGMIRYLGLSGRESLARYGERPEFSDAVKRARLAVEADYERRLDREKAPVGAIFALKNMGWSDRQEVAFSGSLASIDVTRLTDDQLQRIVAGEHPLAVLGSVAPAIRALPAGTAGRDKVSG